MAFPDELGWPHKRADRSVREHCGRGHMVVNHHNQQIERQAKTALAQAQAKQGEYQASIGTYADILTADPSYRPALDQQLATTMLWAEDLHVVTASDQSSDQFAAAGLDQILAIVDSGLNRTKGAQAADVEAQIGCTHWLNQKNGSQGIRANRGARLSRRAGRRSVERVCERNAGSLGGVKGNRGIRRGETFQHRRSHEKGAALCSEAAIGKSRLS